MIVKKGKKHLQLKIIVSNSVTSMNCTCTVNGEKKWLFHLAMVAKFLDLSKPWFCKYMYGRKKNEKKKLTCMTFLSMTALRTKWWPIFFFLRTTMAVSVKKDC